MLLEVGLRNFKLHSSSLVRFALLTVFVGANNSGKSSIAHALLILQEAADAGMGTIRPACQDQSPVDCGPLPGLFNNKDLPLTFSVAGNVRGDGVRFSVSIDSNGSVLRHSGAIEAWDGKWEWASPDQSAGPVELTSLKGVRIIGKPYPPFPNLVRWEAVMAQAGQETRASEIMHSLGQAIPNLLKSVFMCYPERGFERSQYPLQEGKTFRNVVHLPSRAALLTSLFPFNRDLEDRINAWLDPILGVRIRFELTGQQTVTMTVHAARGQGLIVNEGLGVNQLAHVLIPIAMAEDDGTVFVEEPEIHLHPKQQAALAKALARIATKEKRQLVLTTHSEHVLFPILNLVARGEVRPQDLAVYEFQKDGRSCKVVRRQVNSKGQIEGGLKDFFEEDLAELQEFLKAMQGRDG